MTETYRVIPIWKSKEVNIERDGQPFVRAMTVDIAFEVVDAMREWEALKKLEERR